MGSSVLSEVDDTSILRTGLSIGYWHSLNRLPASRLLPPRSGLERSDFVPWPFATLPQEFVSAMPRKADKPKPTRITRSDVPNRSPYNHFKTLDFAVYVFFWARRLVSLCQDRLYV